MVYKNISEIPIYNWVKINETKNLNYLFKDEKKHKQKIFKSELNDLWIELNQQMWDTFGVSKIYKKYFSLVKRKIKLRSQYVLTNDRFLLNEIWLINEDIKNLFDNKVGEKFSQTIWKLKIKTKLDLDPKKISVLEFYELIEVINQQNKEAHNVSN